MCQNDASCVTNAKSKYDKCLVNETLGTLEERENVICKEYQRSYVCKETLKNPDYGYTSFDNFHMAFLTSFRLVALDAWNRLYYLTLHTSGKGYVFFYIGLVFLGSYYLINLILAVVYMAYEEEVAAVEEEIQQMEAEEAERRARQSVLDEARKRDMEISYSEMSQKRESFLNPIPELKVETCETDQSATPLLDTESGNHLPLLKTASNHSAYSVNSAANSTSSKFKTMINKLGTNSRNNVDNISTASGQFSTKTNATQNSSQEKSDSHEGSGELASRNDTAMARWNLIRLKTPDLG